MEVVRHKSNFRMNGLNLGKINVGLFKLHSERISRSLSKRSIDPDSLGLKQTLMSITNNF